MSTGDDILAGMDEGLAALIRNSAAGLARSGVVGDPPLVDAQPADALAMEEAALAAYDPDMPVGVTGNGSQVITRNDIEQLVIAISALYKLPPDKLAEIKSDMLMNVGVPKANFSEISTQAMLRARAASDEITGNQQQMTPQQQIDQLLSDLHDFDEKNRKKTAPVVDQYATYEEKKELEAAQTAVDEAVKSGDAEAQTVAYKKLFALNAKLYPQLRERALKDGNAEAVRIMDEAIQENKEVGEKKVSEAEEIQKAHLQKSKNINSGNKNIENDVAGDWTAASKGIDWGNAQGQNVSMNDVSVQNIGQKMAPKGNSHSV